MQTYCTFYISICMKIMLYCFYIITNSLFNIFVHLKSIFVQKMQKFKQKYLYFRNSALPCSNAHRFIRDSGHEINLHTEIFGYIQDGK